MIAEFREDPWLGCLFFLSNFVGELFEDLQRHRERHEDLLQKVQAVEEM